MPPGSRIAYLITSYTLPDQVLRLASVLRRGSPDAWIAVHHDDRRCRVDDVGLERLRVGRVEPPSRVAWGETSQLAMVLRCLGGFSSPATSTGSSCSPARTTRFAQFPRSSGRSRRPMWMPSSRRSHVSDPRSGRRSTSSQAATTCGGGGCPPAPHCLLTKAAEVTPLVRARAMPSGTWIGVPAWRSPFGPELVCHYGSDWFSLSRAAVEAVDGFRRERPEVLDYYARTLIPTESFVQTVLANDSSLRLSGTNSPLQHLGQAES